MGDTLGDVVGSGVAVSMLMVEASTAFGVTPVMPSLPRLVVRSVAKLEAFTSVSIALALVTVLVRMVTFSVSTPARRRERERRRAGTKVSTWSWTCEAVTPVRLAAMAFLYSGKLASAVA